MREETERQKERVRQKERLGDKLKRKSLERMISEARKRKKGELTGRLNDGENLALID